jgi:hypothetical protein
MAIQITGIAISDAAPTHETIAQYYFQDADGLETGWKTKQQGVAYVDAHPSTVWVAGKTESAWVVVVRNGPNPAYLRTKADGDLTDNLLSVKVY